MTEKLYTGEIVRVQGVTRAFISGGTTLPVLRGVDLDVQAGELVALYGPSGSGKTTLLNLIGALDHPSTGEITVLGQDIAQMRERRRATLRRQYLGFIFQNYTLLPTYSALENIDLALRLPGYGVFERRRRAKAVLQVVGLSAWANHVPEELSGGQQQRVAIARALAARPALILADEPTSGLDTRISRRTLVLFRKIAQTQGTAFIIVSHDPIIADYVDRAFDLTEGRLVPKTSLPMLERDAHDDHR